MNELSLLADGAIALAQQPTALLLAAFGVALGIVIGALPGLTATMGVAILLPFTFGMDTVSGLLMICGVFFGGIYGGSVTAILLKIPGTPAAAATAIDGYELTKKGQGGIAVGTATLSCVIGGVLAVCVLIFMAPVLANIALKFSASETFALAVFGLSIIGSIAGKSPIKGLIAGFFGLLIATIGLDPQGGFPRYTFGYSELMTVPFIPVMIGLFAAAEAFTAMEAPAFRTAASTTIGRIIPPWRVYSAMAPTIGRSTALGIAIGMIPGAGADIGAFVAYNEAKRFSKTPETYGKGELNAVAACESGAGGCTGGALLTMLTLGVPGDAVTAVMLGALTIQGLQPGPLLFQDHAPMIFTLFVGMLFAYACVLAFGLGSVRFIGKVLQMPKSILTPVILALCIVGTYALNNSMFDVGIMLCAGVVGWIMQKWDFPASPIVLALIMGPMAEANFRRALSLSNGSYDFLWTRPITIGLLSVALVTLLLPAVRALLARRRREAAPTAAPLAGGVVND